MKETRSGRFRLYALFFTALLSSFLLIDRADARRPMEANDVADIKVYASGHLDDVDASTIQVRWTWDSYAAPEWTKVNFYRCAGFDPNQQEPISCGLVDTSFYWYDTTHYYKYSDNNPSLGMYYWYFVEICDKTTCFKSRNTHELRSGESYRIKGAWIGEETITPLSPSSVTVSEVERTSEIDWTWMGISWVGGDPRMTDFFEIYYCTDTSEDSCRKFTTTLYETFYTEHRYIKRGDHYYYRVKACARGLHWYETSIRCSAFSDYASSIPGPLPQIPNGISASDGDFSDRIEVTWGASDGATFYNLYRDGALISKPTGTGYVDSDDIANDLEPLTKYSYAVEACNASGCSSMSNSDLGHIIKTPSPIGQGPDSYGNFMIQLYWQLLL